MQDMPTRSGATLLINFSTSGHEKVDMLQTRALRPERNTWAAMESNP